VRQFLKPISEGRPLTSDEAEKAILTIMEGRATPAEIAGFLVGLRARGETVDELLGCVRAMRACMVRVSIEDTRAIDLCGTGGDQSGTFNISTTASFVVAGAGITVAKHGNRSVSSNSGSADVLEALGVRSRLPAKSVQRCIEETGIGFMFAPGFHPAMRHVMPVRRALGIRTLFNIMGPMCNPAEVSRQFIGAFDKEVARMMATILARLGTEHVVTVHAADGLDEISLAGPTTIFEAKAGMDEPEEHTIDPTELGFTSVSGQQLKGGSAEENATILKQILEGNHGPRRDVVLLNAAYAIWVSGRHDNLESSLDAARQSIDSGAAREKLEALIKATQMLEAA
jgi:anthranilate phosphoribosyltransferase